MTYIIRELRRLSSPEISDRVHAINNLQEHLYSVHGNLARLALAYVAHHDPCDDVKNLARKTIGMPEAEYAWERCYCYGIDCHHK